MSSTQPAATKLSLLPFWEELESKGENDKLTADMQVQKRPLKCLQMLCISIQNKDAPPPLPSPPPHPFLEGPECACFFRWGGHSRAVLYLWGTDGRPITETMVTRFIIHNLCFYISLAYYEDSHKLL
jgi:hypothetical protein